ncbi:hypothetical protein GWK41_05820 [Persephonella atlantica]|uniref:Uncharacterized protein n=1 Tax=Persephonella atlantica TaxID=2699429 RepID=A0ABS1GI45_9AQUI|nr:hypothetical protein [Persephonella atlantica]MBK3332578.1 hypothetical protein [Persephonella atlantica]
MISRNYTCLQMDSFLSRLKEQLRNGSFNIIQEAEMTEKKLPFPKIYVLTVEGNGEIFRLSVVMDRNGITVVVPKVEKNKALITQILDSLQV